MQPLETMRNEHGLIRQYLDSLELAAEKLKNNQRPPSEYFETAAKFSKKFSNEFHHVKEEYMMFVRLAQKKGGEMDGQIEALRHQHEHERDFFAEILGAMQGYTKGDPMATSRVVENLGALTAMERQHIHTEDHVFFPLVEQEFSADEMEQVRVEFDKMRAKLGETTFEDCHKMVVEMNSMLAHL
ncbi:MAG: hypothetical protein AMS18_02825 [Gemmatimonas sp. SG8_17]|nr:MAG: hypothetical protein AMS18_02825 [Gemmatimonas sp. SG8_17]